MDVNNNPEAELDRLAAIEAWQASCMAKLPTETLKAELVRVDERTWELTHKRDMIVTALAGKAIENAEQ